MTTVHEASPVPIARRRTGPVRAFATAFASRRLALAAMVFLLLLGAVAVFAPALAPFSPDAQDLLGRLQSPNGTHWLGTDDFGRDVLSRLIFGARVSLRAAAIAVCVGLVLGLPAGVFAGFRGGRIDAFLARAYDGLMSVPGLILALTLVAILGPGLTNAMIAVGVILAPPFFRVARAATQDVRQETYIEAAMALGCSGPRTVLRHVLPNVLPSVIVQMSVALGIGVSAEASLSFLGLGVQPPTASWGSMLTTASQTISVAPYLVWPPGVMIFLTVLAFAFVGEGLQAALGRRRSGGSHA
ncbi:ABC transporter permease [Prescottella defluvii]|uniref:ABC transporter permease n=1 Tax=Prescottella defluvii TaxID=1323361 RepID=UPI0009DE6144|nr:ABC transporter permease [Prescottella defluvii]